MSSLCDDRLSLNFQGDVTESVLFSQRGQTGQDIRGRNDFHYCWLTTWKGEIWGLWKYKPAGLGERRLLSLQLLMLCHRGCSLHVARTNRPEYQRQTKPPLLFECNLEVGDIKIRGSTLLTNQKTVTKAPTNKFIVCHGSIVRNVCHLNWWQDFFVVVFNNFFFSAIVFVPGGRVGFTNLKS